MRDNAKSRIMASCRIWPRKVRSIFRFRPLRDIPACSSHPIRSAICSITAFRQTAYKRDEAYGVQAESAYHLGDSHTIRFGAFYQADDLVSNTSSLALPVDGAGNQTSDVPLTITDNSAKHAWSYSLYIQDEWSILNC